MCLLPKTKPHQGRIVHTYSSLLLSFRRHHFRVDVTYWKKDVRKGGERGGHLTLCSADSPLSDGERGGSDIVIAIDQRGRGKNRRVVCSLVSPLLPKPLQIQKRNGDTRLGDSETALNGSFFNNIHATRTWADFVLFIQGSGFVISCFVHYQVD